MAKQQPKEATWKGMPPLDSPIRPGEAERPPLDPAEIRGALAALEANPDSRDNAALQLLLRGTLARNGW